MKFSLIIGSYNPDLKLIQHALDSALGLFDEIVIVNDGSEKFPDIRTDGSESIHYIKHAKNRGFFEAKNSAIKSATGDIIAILDDDDTLVRVGVSKLQKHILTSHADIWHFHLMMFGKETGLYGVNASPYDLEERNSIPGVSWFRKSVWEALGGFTYPLAEDWDFWLRAKNKGFKFEYFPETVYNFNRRDGSVSSGWTGDKFLAIKKDVLKRNSK